MKGKFPSELAGLMALHELWVSDNDISGEIPSQLGSLREMRDVRFRRNPLLSGTWPTGFWKNKRLNWLDIRGCNITGTLDPAIGEMETLAALRVSRTGFYGSIPTEIGKLKFLRSFWVDNTDISGVMPQEICDAQTHSAFSDLAANCLGDDPQLECACCTGCCLSDGTGCKKMDK